MLKRLSNYITQTDDSDEDIPLPKSYHHNDPINNEEIDLKAEPEKQPKPDKFKFCNLCNQKIYSEDGFKRHLQSKKHTKKIKRITYDEIHQLGSIKRYLQHKKMISRLRHSNISKSLYELYSHHLRQIYKNLPPK